MALKTCIEYPDILIKDKITTYQKWTFVDSMMSGATFALIGPVDGVIHATSKVLKLILKLKKLDPKTYDKIILYGTTTTVVATSPLTFYVSSYLVCPCVSITVGIYAGRKMFEIMNKKIIPKSKKLNICL